mmetsp:Transcript_125438/g.366395  ORF Transcript_125438/g.366395 Transcript_125438/m.366395 type:complete len:159 (+) Transcript_125438:83-559(+)
MSSTAGFSSGKEQQRESRETMMQEVMSSPVMDYLMRDPQVADALLRAAALPEPSSLLQGSEAVRRALAAAPELLARQDAFPNAWRASDPIRQPGAARSAAARGPPEPPSSMLKLLWECAKRVADEEEMRGVVHPDDYEWMPDGISDCEEGYAPDAPCD